MKKSGFLLIMLIALFLSFQLCAETYMIRSAIPGMVGETSVSVVSDKTSFYKDESVTISWNISKVPSKIVINGYGEVNGQTGSVTYVPGVVSEITTTVFFGSGTVPVVTVIPISVGAYGASDISFTSSSNNFYKNDPVTLNWTLPGTPSRIEAIGVGNLATTARSAVVKPGLVNELWLKVYYSDIATPITKKIPVTAIDYGVDDITLSADRLAFLPGETYSYLKISATKNPTKIVFINHPICPILYEQMNTGAFPRIYTEKMYSGCRYGNYPNDYFTRASTDVVTGKIYFNPFQLNGVIQIGVYYGLDPNPVIKTLPIMFPTVNDINITLSKTTFNYDEPITLSWNIAKPQTRIYTVIRGYTEGNNDLHSDLPSRDNIGSITITPGMRKKIIVHVYFAYADQPNSGGASVTKEIDLNPILSPLPETLAAGYNCESIKAATGTTVSGDYTVFVRDKVRAVTCDMVNNGGGWMLWSDYGYNSTLKAINMVNVNSCSTFTIQGSCSSYYSFSPSETNDLKITLSNTSSFISLGYIGAKAMISMANDSTTSTQDIVRSSSGATLYSMSGITPYSLIVITRENVSDTGFYIRSSDSTVLIDKMWVKLY